MDLTRALDFIRDNHRAVLATTRTDGGVQMSLVAAAVDELGKVVISTRETAVKAKNLALRPEATLLVFTDAFYGPWVQVEGPAQLVRLPQAMEALVAYYRAVAGEHPDWDEYRHAMTEERRLLIRISAERAGPDHFG